MTELPVAWIIFAGALVGFAALALMFDGSGARHRRHAQRLAGIAGPSAGAAEAAMRSIRRRQGPEAVGWRAVAARLLPGGPALADNLEMAGIGMRPWRYLALFTVFAAVGGLAVLAFTGSRPLAALVAAAVAIAGPRLLILVLVERRRAKFLLQFPDSIDLMIRSLRAGLPVDEAVVTVGSEGGDAVAPEFRRVADRLAVGQTLEDSLWRSARRLAIPDFDFFIVCLTVQRETGGKLTETLANLSDILRRRLQMRLKVRAMSAEARTSAGIIGSLPFILAAALYAANPTYLAGLFHDPRGQIIVVAALASEALGIFTMIRMARFKI
ncbi:type II secretion system F family protein [Thalassobaculum sp.]|uniref:type II secretion system F family protein n=1 Tax=Thalassobaculum sp. TaxID=2022740 RepID=UPI0032EB8147